MDAAIGFVVAHGDQVDRARLSYLRTGVSPKADVLDKAELGQASGGGWPALWGTDVASIDATCFRLAELDDLGGLARPAARRALDWLAQRQRADGTWEEDEALAADAPPYARPGDTEARLYLTTCAAFWLTVVGFDAQDRHGYLAGGEVPYAEPVRAAAGAIVGTLRPDGTWPSFLVAGWLGAAVLYRQTLFYESARIQMVLGERLPKMSPGDVAAMAAVLRRVGMPADDWLLVAARRRLGETQRSDGGWTSEDGAAFDVHTTLTAIRACR